MKIRVKNGSIIFEKNDYVTVLLDDSNVESNSYVIWSTGKINKNDESNISILFPYKGGNITLTHIDSQWYDKAVICFYTDEGVTYVRFARGIGTSENGLKDYITATYGEDNNDYLIPERDILALGDIKYFRIGSLRDFNLGKATVKYKITETIE